MVHVDPGAINPPVLLVIVQDVEVEKPTPVTETVVPMAPFGGEKDIDLAVEPRLKLAAAESPVFPFTVTLYVPGLIPAPTVNDPLDMLPEAIVQVGDVMNPVEGPVAVIVHVVSPPAKPLPVTVTTVPLGPLGGDIEIETALTGI